MTANYEIRRASHGDLPGVLMLRPEFRGSGPPTTREAETWARMMATADLSVFVASTSGEIIGTATSMAMPNITYDCAPSLFIEGVLVLAAHRRKGVATSILRAVLTDAERRGCNKVQLLSHKWHATDGAHELYIRLGFEAEAEGFRLYLAGAD
jgi:GNAT superfamily N-acetyltransferase